MRIEIAALVAEGKSYDEVVDYHIAKYGSQEVLSSPIDEGFNRLAWFFPYAIGLVGVMVLGGVAVRWSRQSPSSGAPTGTGPTADTAVTRQREERLDDELRDLD